MIQQLLNDFQADALFIGMIAERFAQGVGTDPDGNSNRLSSIINNLVCLLAADGASSSTARNFPAGE